MEPIATKTLQLNAESVFEKAISYPQYREEVSQLVEKNASSGLQQTEALINYTILNDRRMKRWDKTLKLSAEELAIIDSFNTKVQQGERKPQKWLVLTESWCGDASQSIPVMNAIAARSLYIDFRVSYRDESLELMDQVLTRGNRAIPKLIVFIEDGILGTWGARPEEGQKMIDDYKKEHGELSAVVKENLQRWYNKDKGNTIKKEFLGFLQ